MKKKTTINKQTHRNSPRERKKLRISNNNEEETEKPK